MWFVVERVSEHYIYDEAEPDNFGKAPCPEAKLISTPDWVECEYGDPKIWMVRLDSLLDLVRFCQKHGRVILEPNYWKYAGIEVLRIYDGYVE